jgi:hypothetical protein
MKTLLVFTFLMAASVVFAQNLDDSLLIYYPFNGNALDSSGNDYDGITNAEYTFDRFGNPQGAIHFNGFDQYLAFPPNRPGLKPPLPVSFAFWVNFEVNSPQTSQIFNTDYDQNNYSGVWSAINPDGTFGLSYGSSDNGIGPAYRRTKKGTSIIQENIWYFVICIVKGPEDMDIWLNCINDEGSYSGYGGDLAYTDCQGGLGRTDADPTLPPYYFQGTIDDFMYWGRELSLEDIDSLCVMVGLEDNSFSETDMIKVFPNPSDECLYIENLPWNCTSIDIYSVSGIFIQSFPPVNKIETPPLKPGSYIIRFNDDVSVIQNLKFLVK